MSRPARPRAGAPRCPRGLPRARLAPVARAGGFSLLELVVVVIAVGIMAGLALDRLLPLVGSAQRVAFLQVESELQSALLLEAAERISRGQDASLEQLADSNPMRLLLKPPPNYAGKIGDARRVPGNTWYYDAHSGRLGYRVGRHTRFEPVDGPEDRVEFRVSFVYRDRDGDGVFEAGRDDFSGLRLDSVYSYRWPN